MMKSDPQQEKRELRLKIGRMRRRIDARLRATETEGRKLASWRTYVTRYPGSAVLAAFGLGLSGATFFASSGTAQEPGTGHFTRLGRSGSEIGLAGTAALLAV